MTVMCLSDLGQVITGNTPSKSIDDFYDSEDICFVKPSDFYSNSLSKIDKTENYLSEKARCVSRIVPKGSILVTCIGIIGKVAVLNGDAAFNQQINAIIPDKKKVLPMYLAYSLLSKQQELAWQANAAVVPIINKSQFSKLQLDIPDIDSQNKIISVLSKVDTLTTRFKKQLEDLDLLIKSRFIEMFGLPFGTHKYSIKKLKDISTSISDGSNIDKTYYMKEGEVLFLRIQNVWSNEFRLQDSVYITKEVNSKYFDTSLHKGDLLITKIGRFYTQDSSLGRVSVYLGDNDKANYSNNIMRIRLDNSVLSEYVNSLFNLDDYNKYIRKVSVGGTDKRALSKAIIGDLPVIMAPMELQREYVNFLAQVDKSKLAVQQSLNELETLKKSLMQQYFG